VERVDRFFGGRGLRLDVRNGVEGLVGLSVGLGLESQTRRQQDVQEKQAGVHVRPLLVT
jgi:hypothetical protein